jgi:hypothetical protein
MCKVINGVCDNCGETLYPQDTRSADGLSHYDCNFPFAATNEANGMVDDRYLLPPCNRWLPSDPIAPARGIFHGMLLGCLFWVGLGVLILWLITK